MHSDSIMLMRTDPSRHRIYYLSIPRDIAGADPGSYGHAEDQRGDADRRAGARDQDDPPSPAPDQSCDRRQLRDFKT
jgi:hypothetical protein